MTAVVAARRGRTLRAGAPGRAITRLAWRQVRRGTAILTLCAAGISALVVGTYDSVIASAPGGAASLAVLAGNPAIRTLFGDPVALDDPGGFAVWRTGTVLAVLTAVWAAVATTRVLRGEEDAGRWDLLLSGVAPVGSAVGRHLAVMVASVTAVGAATAVALIAAGTSPAGAVLHGGALALVGAFAVAVAALASQLASDRAAATGAAVAIVVAGLLLRMVGDGLDALAWLRWLSPFGLAALAEPFGADDPLPLLMGATGTLALLLVVPVAARRRDLRDGLLAARGPRRPRTALLGSVSAFEVRGTLRPLTGWTLGIGAFLLLIGLVSRSMTDFLAQNPMFAALAAEAGFADLGSVEGYAATLFALLTVPVGGFVASRVSALAAAETARRLDLLLAGPTTRLRLVGSAAVAAAGGALVLTVAAGAAMWTGSGLVGSGLGIGDALAGAVSTTPVAALGLGGLGPATRRCGGHAARSRRLPAHRRRGQHRRAAVGRLDLTVHPPGPRPGRSARPDHPRDHDRVGCRIGNGWDDRVPAPRPRMRVLRRRRTRPPPSTCHPRSGNPAAAATRAEAALDGSAGEGSAVSPLRCAGPRWETAAVHRPARRSRRVPAAHHPRRALAGAITGRRGRCPAGGPPAR